MQMLTLNVHQNYERDYRRGWQCITISMMLVLIWMLSIYYMYGFSRIITNNYIVYVCSCFVLNSMTFAVFISFTTLLNNLHRRFAIVNSCLRYHYSIPLNSGISELASTLWIRLVFFQNRNFFARKEFVFKGAVCQHRTDTIYMIKFIGRQYSSLVSTMDKISAFYAFQVTYLH